MDFVCNFPPFSIIFCLACGIISSALNGRAAKRLSIALVSLVGVMSACVLAYTVRTGEAFVYVM